MDDDFKAMAPELQERIMADAKADILHAKDMINEALMNVAQHRGELTALTEEHRIAMMARQILEWGDPGGVAVVAATAILRLGGFR